ncbi:MAG: lysophospholipid acyltransferase family protein, partial [bacterium]
LQSGAAFLALRTGIPIVPAAITGIAEVWPLGARFPRAGAIAIRLGPALHPKHGERPEELTQRIEGGIRKLLGQATSADDQAGDRVPDATDTLHL